MFVYHKPDSSIVTRQSGNGFLSTGGLYSWFKGRASRVNVGLSATFLFQHRSSSTYDEPPPHAITNISRQGISSGCLRIISNSSALPSAKGRRFVSTDSCDRQVACDPVVYCPGSGAYQLSGQSALVLATRLISTCSK